jgi:transcriptional regulator with XRE-family HTH domain
MEEDGYLAPNGREIRRLRKGKGWTAQVLADKADVGLDTVKKAERGERKQVGSLLKIASALGVTFRTILLDPDQVPVVAVDTSKIRVFSTWAEVDRFIASAKKSIVIIDSFFSEFARLGLLVQQAVRDEGKDLKIRIYMASPEKDFGAQRKKEMGQLADRRNSYKELLAAELSDDERDSYEDRFHDYEAGIREHLGKYPGVAIEVFEYPCMPSIRIIVVDGKHFVFGWFPLLAQNPTQACFYLEDAGLSGADVDLRDNLSRQIKNVEMISDPARNRSERARKNHRGKSSRRHQPMGP